MAIRHILMDISEIKYCANKTIKIYGIAATNCSIKIFESP